MFADQTAIPLMALYRQGTDPATDFPDGRVTPGIMWLDTSTGAIGTLKKRNEAGTGWDTLINFDSKPFQMTVAVGDETTAITAGTNKLTFRMPRAVTLTAVRASLSTAQASGSIFTVDVNEGGSSILSTKLTIDNTEKTSTTAATPPVISDANLADDAEISIDVDQVGDGTAKGLKVTLIGSLA